MNQTDVFTCFDNVLKDAVNAKLQKKLDKLESILNTELQGHIDADLIHKLVQGQRYDIRTTLKLIAARKARVKRDIDPNTRCLARIGLGTQCSRSRMDNADFCKSHHISRPYGQIGMPEMPNKKIAKRRGRRSKYDRDYTVDDLDMDKYVQAILIHIGDEPYLMDQNNVLYQFNSNNEIVGHVNNDKVEWY